MKHFHIIILLSLILAACSPQQVGGLTQYATLRQVAQTGDLLFLALPQNYGDTTNTSSIDQPLNYIHTAILEVGENGNVWVIDATYKRGVDRHPLDTLFHDFTLRNGGLPHMQLMRLRDTTGVSRYINNAKHLLGRPYDCTFSPDDKQYYCTELIYDTYRDHQNHLFECAPLDFHAPNGTIPYYWVRLFRRLHTPMPQGKLGITPNSLIQSPILIPIAQYN